MLIGTATSAHQIEGNNKNSDWWYFENSGRLKHKSGIACDSYNHFKDDINLMKKLKLNSYKFSIEFARIMPKRNLLDLEAVDHYKELISELKRNYIEPIPTLWHYTFPMWFYKLGGFEKKKNIAIFVDYVKALLNEGLDAKYVITINEPVVYALKSYLTKAYPPFKRSFRQAYRMINNLIHLNNELYDLLKKEGYQTGCANNLIYFGKARRIIPFLHLSEYFYNIRFIKYTKADFIGINYYHDMNLLLSLKLKKAQNEMGWSIYPYGLHYLVENYYNRFKKPIMVTENGIATTNEELKSRFISEHFEALLNAKKEGVPILGYHYWSLLDNFEWNYGYTKKFGVAYVDKKTGKRVLKKSAYSLKKIAEKYSMA